MEDEKVLFHHLDIVAELGKMFAAVTNEQVDRVGALLGSLLPSEEALGAIHSEEARRLWTLASNYDRLGAEAIFNAKFEARTDTEMKERLADDFRARAFEEVARNLFWLTVKQDIGGKAWTASSIGVRSGWMLVAKKKEASTTITQIGGFRLPPGFNPFGAPDEDPDD